MGLITSSGLWKSLQHVVLQCDDMPLGMQHAVYAVQVHEMY